MKYKLIRSLDDLRGGDVAVFAHPSAYEFTHVFDTEVRRE